jgi:hypothetical protein
MSWRNERDRIVNEILAQGGDDPWARLPSSENVEQGAPLPAPSWDEGFGPVGWPNIGRLNGASEINISNDSVDNTTGLPGEMGNQDIYNRTLDNIYRMNLSNESVEPPYFDPRINAGDIGGYNPWAENPLADPSYNPPLPPPSGPGETGFFEGSSPYDNAGASGIPGSYGAPGAFGRHRRGGL